MELSVQRPGSKIIKGEDELKLIKDYIVELTSNFKNISFSIDTYNSVVADFALKNGFNIINDISSGKYDVRLLDIIKEYQAGYVIMHMQGDPENMQEKPTYKNVVSSISGFLIQRLRSFTIKILKILLLILDLVLEKALNTIFRFSTT
ncbi:MAG: hypothetical protein CM15mP102_11690 [Flavobacteriales bacterium]|nr:MAG: hypothetical protein CM15mP102_11690 [Flavobacteriales bacterium]